MAQVDDLIEGIIEVLDDEKYNKVNNAELIGALDMIKFDLFNKIKESE